MRDVYDKSTSLMGTVVTMQVVGHAGDAQAESERHDAVERAFGWFHDVESCCSRFDQDSEVMRLGKRFGVPVPVSALLFTAVECAIAIATDSRGAFDPTIGYEMERRGFNREYRTGQVVRTDLGPRADDAVSYRDVHLDADRRTITLDRPLILDLGSVAKGLAVDRAAQELRPLSDYAIDAGGDLYLAGRNPRGAGWSVGIRHPRDAHKLIDTLQVSDRAVCTSGDYERPAGVAGGHHVLDPRTRTSATGVVSATTVGTTAMLADALATAAFVLGPTEGIALLERHGVDGLVLSPEMERFATRGMRSDFDAGDGASAQATGSPAVLPNT